MCSVTLPVRVLTGLNKGPAIKIPMLWQLEKWKLDGVMKFAHQ